jgi:hypothetical protein
MHFAQQYRTYTKPCIGAAYPMQGFVTVGALYSLALSGKPRVIMLHIQLCIVHRSCYTLQPRAAQRTFDYNSPDLPRRYNRTMQCMYSHMLRRIDSSKSRNYMSACTAHTIDWHWWCRFDIHFDNTIADIPIQLAVGPLCSPAVVPHTALDILQT